MKYKPILALTALALAGCNEVPKSLNQTLAPLKQEATAYCKEVETDLKSFYQGEKNSWTTARKNALMEMLECNPKSVQWRCAFTSVVMPAKLVETTGDYGCTDESVEAKLKELTQDENSDYFKVLNGTGDWSYENWLKRR